ncbi:MAG TPA: arsenate reductase (azurin) small subunit, partial [Acetobacteraceae bacterium]|nr:arsenate reductase (azurin) small subunit [Acetobacteraceae bacterium]
MPLTRRGLVQSGVVAGALGYPVFARAAFTMPDGRPWPTVKAANVNELEPGKPVSFNYPDASSPAWLVKLK